MTKERIPVVFRKFNDGDIIALFPTMDENDNCINSYMHVGQHGAAGRSIVNCTKLATPAEYDDLYKELRNIYDDAQLVPRKRLIRP